MLMDPESKNDRKKFLISSLFSMVPVSAMKSNTYSQTFAF